MFINRIFVVVAINNTQMTFPAFPNRIHIYEITLYFGL